MLVTGRKPKLKRLWMVLLPDKVKITIQYDGRGSDCDARCGLDWSSSSVAEMAIHRLKDKFGDRVKMEISEADSETSLSINGQVRIAGPFDLRQLMDAIEMEMEMKR